MALGTHVGYSRVSPGLYGSTRLLSYGRRTHIDALSRRAGLNPQASIVLDPHAQAGVANC